jgi:hypothetical protein
MSGNLLLVLPFLQQDYQLDMSRSVNAMIVNDALDPLKVCPFRSHQSQGETKDQDKGGVFNVKTTGV